MKLHNILSKLRQTAPLHLREGLGVGLCLLLFTACETIDEGDRWTDAKPIEMKKNVLVEDFTGQKCVICPNAANLLHNLATSTMGEHIVAVGIHGGAMSLNINTPIGLATELGEDYNKHFGVQAWPSGMVDRTDGNGNAGKTCDFTSWTAAIVSQLSKELLVDLSANTTFNAETRVLHIDVSAEATQGHTLTADMKLTVWLTESGVVGQQLMPDASTNREYVHNHVLRESLSDPYGDTMTIDSNRATVSYSHTIPATYGKNKWAVNPEEMAVVAFVTDAKGEVLQVIDVPVVK
ncbi:MAG: Omp28 family outer membrane lipoprotein [Bacteroidales bacterium]|nr:Omp28 family outer membrane lipoprotein [Bacteroidales bacterium]